MAKKWVVLIVTMALVAAAVSPILVARRFQVSPANPMARQFIDIYDLIVETRAYMGTDPIDTTFNPIGLDDGRFLYLLGFNTQALTQLWEAVSRRGEIVNLEDLMNISHFGSPRALFKLLLFYQFPDEAELADLEMFQIEKPDWWDAWPPGDLF